MNQTFLNPRGAGAAERLDPEDQLIDAEADSLPAPQPPVLNRGARILLGVSLVLIAFNLRPLFSSLSVLLPEVMQATGLSTAGASVLTTLPVLCMGVFAPSAQRLAARVGTAGAVELAAACLAVGTALRFFGGQVWPLYAGTFVAGVGIAVGGTLLPGLVKEMFPPRRSGLVTGLYMFAMMGGATASSALAVPLRDWLGSWQGTTAASSTWSSCVASTFSYRFHQCFWRLAWWPSWAPASRISF